MMNSSMPLKIYTTDEVFGISRELPLNYVSRPTVDEALIENLTRDKHIVIYGSSKQGKTCVRKHCLKDEDYISVQCSNKWSIDDLLSNILKRAGFKITLSDKKATSGKYKILASITTGLFPLKAKIGGEHEVVQEEEVTEGELELDPSDVNDVIAALTKSDFNKYIVLEDFHYLTTETQKDFSVSLKAFHEASKFCFIVIGVWLEESRLVVYNGDLTGRLISINADRWMDSELKAVVREGERLLNIAFEPKFVDTLVIESYGSIYIVQEACRQACLLSEIRRTQETLKQIGDKYDARAIVKGVVDEQGARYKSFISQFASGFQATQLEMYKWLLYPILSATSKQLEDGFKYADLRRSMSAHHPQGQMFNPGNLTQALQSTASLQIGKGITPIILDYDRTNSILNVVDRGFVIWLQNQNKGELFEEVGLPIPDKIVGQTEITFPAKP